jgi:hypothetical protein
MKLSDEMKECIVSEKKYHKKYIEEKSEIEAGKSFGKYYILEKYLSKVEALEKENEELKRSLNIMCDKFD